MNISDHLNNILKSLKEKGADPIVERHGAVDIAYPSSEKEYCALGSYSVLKVVATAADKKELPIERAYFQLGDEKIMPLTNLGVSISGGNFLAEKVTEIKDDKDRIYFENISFWTIPTGFFLDDDGLIAIDFKGERKHFVILRGPWKQATRTYEWVQKHTSGQMQVAAGPIGYDLIANFIEREFIKGLL